MKVALNGLKIFAYHGWYDEEALLGNYFSIDFEVTIPNPSYTDELSETLNYEILHNIVVEEMAERSKLLEHVIFRIKSNLIANYPHAVRAIKLSVKKLNPIFGTELSSTQVSIQEDYLKNCAKCNGAFNCFNSPDCWCKSINLSDVTRGDLQRQYTGCLCEVCLNQFAEPPAAYLNL